MPAPHEAPERHQHWPRMRALQSMLPTCLWPMGKVHPGLEGRSAPTGLPQGHSQEGWMARGTQEATYLVPGRG